MNTKSFINAIKSIITVLRAYVAGGWRTTNRAWPVIYVDFQDTSTYRRYHMTIALAVSRFPANVVWRFRPKYLIKGKEPGEVNWWRKKFFRFDFFGLKVWNHNLLAVLTDAPESYRQHGHLRVIEVNGNLSENSSRTEQDFEWPYLGHPDFLFNAIEVGNSWHPETSKQLPKQYRVCFAGNCDPSLYRFSPGLERMGVMSRVCAKETIESIFGPEILKIEAWPDKEKLSSPHRHSIVISNSYKAGLNFTEYCKLLRESIFFLALPGLGSPRTHSLYESLYCGCIPILPESPVIAIGWIDRQNCLLFRDAESLISAVDWALKIDDESLRVMQMSAQKVFNEKYEMETAAKSLLRSDCRRLIFKAG